MSLDDALEFLGVKGLFPLGIYVLTLYIGICTPWISLIDSFAGYVPQHHCAAPDSSRSINLSDFLPPDIKTDNGFAECRRYANEFKNETETCDEYVFVLAEGETLAISYVPSWDLVCDRIFWSKFATTMFFVGNVIGCLIFTTLSDKYGRLKVFMATLWGQGAVGAIAAFSDSMGGLPTYIFWRTVLGALSSGVYNVGFVYMNELFPPIHRAVVGNVVNIVWSVATAALPGLAWLLPDWRMLMLAVSLPNLVSIPWILFFPESLPWLRRNGRSEEATEYLHKVAYSRNLILPDFILQTVSGGGEKNEEEKVVQEDVSFVGLMRHTIIVRCVLIGMGLFFINSLVYYGLTMSSTSLSDDRYFNFFLSGLAEIPGYIIGMISTKYFGRRRPMMALFGVAGTALVTTATLHAALKDPPSAAVTIFTFLGKFGISGTYGIVFLFVTEIFPTNTRNVALGLCNVGGRMGSIWSPFTSVLQEKSPTGLQFSFGFGALFGVVGTYFLPETNNRPLPNNIDDLKELDRLTRRFRRVNAVDDKAKLLTSDELGQTTLEMNSLSGISSTSYPPPEPIPPPRSSDSWIPPPPHPSSPSPPPPPPPLTPPPPPPLTPPPPSPLLSKEPIYASARK